MDDWFQLHSLIVGYLNTFEYAISTEGDKRLQVHYRRYVTRYVRNQPVRRHRQDPLLVRCVANHADLRKLPSFQGKRDSVG